MAQTSATKITNQETLEIALKEAESRGRYDETELGRLMKYVFGENDWPPVAGKEYILPPDQQQRLEAWNQVKSNRGTNDTSNINALGSNRDATGTGDTESGNAAAESQDAAGISDTGSGNTPTRSQNRVRKSFWRSFGCFA